MPQLAVLFFSSNFSTANIIPSKKILFAGFTVIVHAGSCASSRIAAGSRFQVSRLQVLFEGSRLQVQSLARFQNLEL
jgi:hypothetical protein